MSEEDGGKKSVPLGDLYIPDNWQRLDWHYGMLELMKRAMVFWKLAEEEKGQYSEKELQELLQDPYGENIANFRRRWDVPVKDVQKIMDAARKQLIEESNGNNYAMVGREARDILEQAFSSGWSNLAQGWFDRVTQDFLDKYQYFTVDNLISLEYRANAALISETTKRRAINETLKMILSRMAATRHSGIKLEMQDQFSQELMAELEELYQYDEWIPKSLIEGLAQRMGPEFYVQMMRHLKPLPDMMNRGLSQQYKMDAMNKFLKRFEKPVLTVGDVAFIISQMSYMDMGKFKMLLEKGTEEAKQYLRSFLYIGDDKDFFILDEELQPINSKYQNIAWPSMIRALRLPRAGLTYQEWAPIFEAFQIIPAA